MSFLIEEEMECPACKYPNKVEVWSVVNVKEDPELKDILLGGEMNMAECTSCKHVFYAEHFIIYHESDRELMAFVYPFSYRPDAKKWEEKTAADFAVFQQDSTEPLTYKPVTIFGLDELVQLVQSEEEMSIQGEIVRTLAEEHHFPIETLKPAQARALKLPSVLPLAEGSGEVRERLKKGVDQLLELNPHLFVYRTLQKELENGDHVRVGQ